MPSTLRPREYQQKIAEAASTANTLVVLPTGLGKTLVAVLVAKKRLEKLPEGKVVVMAPTRPLILQHLTSFREAMSLGEAETALLTGEVPPEERGLLWRRARFVFATPQTIRNDVSLGRFDLADVVLMVFDEAHRAVKDYSYAQLARLYRETARDPLILGLTASPGGSREKINEITRNMSIERVEARSEQDEDVLPYVEETKSEGVKVTLPQEYDQVLAPLRELYNEKVSRLVQAGVLPKGRVSKKLLLQARGALSARLKGAGGASKGYIFGSLINQAQAVMVIHAIELAETQGMDVLLKYMKRTREKPEQGKSAASLLRDARWLMAETEAERLRSVDHPKLTQLIATVKEQLARKPGSRIIVFTQYRDTIESITRRLSREGITSERFVGQADKVDSEGMDQRRQAEILEKFADGAFAVLVSSSIGEEGLHVPDVDLVVFYEAVPSEIRAIQRKGRTGRTRPGRVVVLLTEGTVDEAYYFSSLHRERSMRDLISGGAGAKPERKAPRRNPTLLDYVG